MNRTPFKLVFKKNLLPQTFYFVFESACFLNFKPGQFFSLEISEKNFRSYSAISCSHELIVDLTEGEIKNTNPNNCLINFIINTKPNGLASNFFEKIKLNTTLQGLGPLGNFTYLENKFTTNFLATGTGLAPFIGMIDQILSKNPITKINVFFGAWKKTDDISEILLKKYLNKDLYPNFNLIQVFENLEGFKQSSELIEGRISDALKIYLQSLENNEFYICGHPLMVTNVAKDLESWGVLNQNIHLEKYGK